MMLFNSIKYLLIILKVTIGIVITPLGVQAKTLRWKTMPVKVCIPDNQYKPLMKRAFFEWMNITNGKVKFLYTCTSPEITISYSPKKNKSLTNYSYTSDGYIFKSHIDMALLTREGKVMEDDVLLLVMEHEIAHALGISGHVNTPNSIMQPTVKKGYTITADILAEINKRYK